MIGCSGKRRQHRAIAIAIETDAEEMTPQPSVHVTLHLNDTTRREVEAELVEGVCGHVTEASA